MLSANECVTSASLRARVAKYVSLSVDVVPTSARNRFFFFFVRRAKTLFSLLSSDASRRCTEHRGVEIYSAYNTKLLNVTGSFLFGIMWFPPDVS